jgi:hypothetical protein
VCGEIANERIESGKWMPPRSFCSLPCRLKSFYCPVRLDTKRSVLREDWIRLSEQWTLQFFFLHIVGVGFWEVTNFFCEGSGEGFCGLGLRKMI